MYQTNSSNFLCHNPKGKKYLRNFLREHKFTCFEDTLNALCECALEVETKRNCIAHCNDYFSRHLLVQKQQWKQNNVKSVQS